MLPTLILASDIHGSAFALHLLVGRAKQYQAEKILIAGDLCPPDSPEFRTLLTQEAETLLVRGNCDGSYEFSNAKIHLPPLVQRLQWGERTLVMTHGDRFPSPYGLDMKTGDIFISGHTHTPHLARQEDGIITINPGSTTFPRTPLGPTYALLFEEGISIRSLDDDRPLPSMQYYFM
ncbi:YfcE family phosphodiesterase [Sphaerochaeta globosa]|jgi:hypothetical protein|uniref:Phosphoesterase n=1 Tax=Sphaerochaeta globosa (strain ATCC BAA-1886 / DSM 22777 / Buddy) TaxID=158189 RepID=F0RRY9_SPHGB|nr:YfcE family phosphodiesterase [Sphaerochaeta globosa]ADY14594.1 phosphodiesterase, MJ0936 family [Sphaerochaeta globosa str. Buddy]